MNLKEWVLGGQARFRDVVSEYFRGSRVALAVYDTTRYFSHEHLTDWIERVKQNASDCSIVFEGGKTDERSNGSGVTLEMGRGFASQ